MASRGRVALTMAILGVAACGGQPEPAGGARLPSEPVEVLIDDRGIPHIYAQNDEDLFFAYGYQLASDRMLQLEMFRRFAHGQLSEVLGAGGPGSVRGDSLTDDKFARIFHWKKWGALDAAWMRDNDPEQYALTSAWADGINRRVDEVLSGAAPPPYGFEALGFAPSRWTHDDVYIVQKMIGFGLDQTILYEVLITFISQLAPQALESIQLFKPARATYALPEEDRPQSASMSLAPAPRGQTSMPLDPSALAALGRLQHLKALGSNNWAVDGRHSDNGMPLVAGDPHLGYAFGGIMYALHLNSLDGGGHYDNAGFAFAAVPGMFAGHNRQLAYTPTSAFADVMDMWAVEIVDGQAMIAGEPVATEERVESIAVKDGEPLELVVVDVPGYGVILDAEVVGSPISIAGPGKHALVGWTGFRARPARYFRPLMRATTLDELEAAVDAMPEMTYNFVGADSTGISYRVGVDIPARSRPAPGHEPWMVMDGSDPAAWWPEGAFLGADQKPHSRASARGWIATANNDPFGFTDDGRVDNDPWYYGPLFPPGWRASRIEAELTRLCERGAVTLEDMQALQLDVHSNLADDLIPPLVEAHAAIATDPDLAEFAGDADLDALVQLIAVDWDRQMRRDSSGALAFHAFAHLVTAALFEDDISPILFEQVLDAAPMYMLKIAALALNDAYPDGDAVMQGGKHRIVLEGLAATADFLRERFGGVDPANYRYADMRVSSMDHAFGRAFDLVDPPTDGGESTVNVAQSKFREGGAIAEQWVSHWGPIERQVMRFRDDGTPEAYANFPMGNVADPAGPHFDDELENWLEGRYEKILYERSEIEAALESRYEIPAAR